MSKKGSFSLDRVIEDLLEQKEVAPVTESDNSNSFHTLNVFCGLGGAGKTTLIKSALTNRMESINKPSKNVEYFVARRNNPLRKIVADFWEFGYGVQYLEILESCIEEKHVNKSLYIVIDFSKPHKSMRFLLEFFARTPHHTVFTKKFIIVTNYKKFDAITGRNRRNYLKSLRSFAILFGCGLITMEMNINHEIFNIIRNNAFKKVKKEKNNSSEIDDLREYMIHPGQDTADALGECSLIDDSMVCSLLGSESHRLTQWIALGLDVIRDVDEEEEEYDVMEVLEFDASEFSEFFYTLNTEFAEPEIDTRVQGLMKGVELNETVLDDEKLEQSISSLLLLGKKGAKKKKRRRSSVRKK
ncbi:hypothetical protein PCE1_004833 [Barthelona sp. PCE]